MGALFAACGDNVWVGNADFCDERGDKFDVVIHVHHEKSPTPGRCKKFEAPTGGKAADLFLRYIDGSSLTSIEIGDRLHGKLEWRSAPQALREIAAYSAHGNRLLCHCAAGLCRGPTMAVIAKVARGCTPWQAMHDVANGMWLGYQAAPQLFNLPMTEICRWYWDGDRR